MKTRAKQTGITFFGLLLGLVIGGFFVLLGLKLGPLYLENYTIQMALQKVKQDPGAAEMSPLKIRDTIAKQLYINQVERIKEKDIQIKHEGDVTRVSIDYEARAHIMYNADAALVFSNSVEIPSR